jgi:hypothetical protein
MERATSFVPLRTTCAAAMVELIINNFRNNRVSLAPTHLGVFILKFINPQGEPNENILSS